MRAILMSVAISLAALAAAPAVAQDAGAVQTEVQMLSGKGPGDAGNRAVIRKKRRYLPRVDLQRIRRGGRYDQNLGRRVGNLVDRSVPPR